MSCLTEAVLQNYSFFGEGKGCADIMAKLSASGSNINELVVSPPKVFAYLRVLQALHGDAAAFVSLRSSPCFFSYCTKNKEKRFTNKSLHGPGMNQN